LAVDLNWELTILEMVQDFYRKLLEDVLHEEVTPPSGLEAEALSARDRDVEVLLPAMRRWLKLLDLAITPEMLRRSLASPQEQEIAEALIRYSTRKQSKSDVDRDKTDFAVTYLYRNPRVAGQWESRGYSMDGVAPVPPFEIALMEILDDAELPELLPEESRMLDEFEFLAEDAEHIGHFDRLMDSGVMAKARRIKHGFGPAFYHPHALAVIASYNERFGRRFAELFTAAARHVKSYAEEVQQRGGSLSSRVDGDITVQHLTQVEESEILGTEYRRAQEHFQHVSRLKKAVDSRTLSRALDSSGALAATLPSAPVAPVPTAAPAAPPSALEAASAVAAGDGAGLAGRTAAGAVHAKEDSRIRSVEESIRNWVRAADERCRNIIPMKFGNFVLQAQEVDAYAADFREEESFRGSNARALIRMVAIIARMEAEGQEFKQRQNSTHLWRPHAETLVLLEEAAGEALEAASAVLEVANQRGLAEKAKLLTATMDRLSSHLEQTRQLLSVAESKVSAP
jgi:hypothetical protein